MITSLFEKVTGDATHPLFDPLYRSQRPASYARGGGCLAVVIGRVLGLLLTISQSPVNTDFGISSLYGTHSRNPSLP